MECVLGSSFSQVHGGVKGSSSHSCRGDHPGDRQWVTVASEGSAGLSFVTPSEGNCGFQLQEQVAALVSPGDGGGTQVVGVPSVACLSNS